jgi:hypothetical protein
VGERGSVTHGGHEQQANRLLFRRKEKIMTQGMTLSQAMDIVFTVFPNAIVDERHGEIVILTGAKAVGLDEKLEPVEAGV